MTFEDYFESFIGRITQEPKGPMGGHYIYVSDLLVPMKNLIEPVFKAGYEQGYNTREREI